MIKFIYDDEIILNQDQDINFVNSKYDHHFWDFSPKIVKRNVWSSINIQVEQIEPKDKTRVLNYNFSLPILIKKNNWIRVLDTSADILLPIAGLLIILVKAAEKNSPWINHYIVGFFISVGLYVLFRIIVRFWNDK